MKTDVTTWQEPLREQGFVVFRGLSSAEAVRAARTAIEFDLRTNYDVRLETEYDNGSYCPGLRSSPLVRNLLWQTPVIGLLDRALGLDRIVCGQGQIAVRRPGFTTGVVPQAHIDGFPAAGNGVPRGTIAGHSALVGVFLTDVRKDNAGNFTVWPGSHRTYEAWFRSRGQRAMSEPMPRPELGSPLQLRSEPGDIVLCPYHLGHAAAMNCSLQTRIAVFFRLTFQDFSRHQWKYLTNVWAGWGF